MMVTLIGTGETCCPLTSLTKIVRFSLPSSLSSLTISRWTSLVVDSWGRNVMFRMMGLKSSPSASKTMKGVNAVNANWDKTYIAPRITCKRIIAERRMDRERSEANNHVLFEIPRYLYIHVCLHVHCTRPCTPYASPITLAQCSVSFKTLAAVRSTTFRSLTFARYGWWRQFSGRQSGRRQQLKPYVYSYQTQEAPGQRQQLKPYVYSYRTQEAPGRRQRLGLYAYNYYTQEAQLKPDCGTVGRAIASRMTLAYFFSFFFICTCTFPSTYWTYIHTFRISLICYYSFSIAACVCALRMPSKLWFSNTYEHRYSHSCKHLCV